MLTLDEMLAPVAEAVATTPYTFEHLRGRPRLDLRPMSMRNRRWLEHALADGIKADAAPPAEDAVPALAIAARLRGMHEDADMYAVCLVAGIAVEDEPGVWTPRTWGPSGVAEFLHRLIDLEQGMAEFMALQKFIVEISNAATKSTLDPEKTAGNSSGG